MKNQTANLNFKEMSILCRAKALRGPRSAAIALLTVLISLLAPAAGATIILPSVIGDGMVLQQSTDALLWGFAEPGSKISVTPSWSDKKITAVTNSDGRWEVRVATPAASFTPYSIRIQGDGSDITLSDVLSGEVWLCSGQSNMEMPLRGFGIQPIENADRAIAYAGKYPGIRVHTTPKLASYKVEADAPGSGWKVSNPENAPEFSACAYFFARSLSDILNVPVGLVVNAYGGSKVEGWMPEEMVRQFPDFDIDKEKADPDFNEWERATVMYNAMLRPLAGYTVKGFLWNQGESNVGRHDTYPERMEMMISHWRDLWGDQKLPFYFVEIPGWNYDNPEADNAARLREAQHLTAAMIPDCDIVCTSDLVYPYEVDDIHARQKEPLGERLAFLAASKTYGIPGIHVDYPRIKDVNYQGPKAVLTFHNRYGGFTPNQLLPGFEVAGTDRKFYPARAEQDWNTYKVTVSSDSVPEIAAVRYCFKNFARGEVHDMLGLPLVPFRTDKWDNTPDKDKFVTVADGKFMIGDKEYKYVGANFWYGGILGSTGEGGDRDRLERELDAMQAAGIDNVRVMVGGDGREGIPSHVSPVLQTAPGVYNDALLDGLDWLMMRLEERGMKAVLFLNNAWEWSGGYGSYLEWAGLGKAPVPSETSYPEYMQFVSQFPVNDTAKQLSYNHVRNIVGRTNRYTGRPYSESPAIMSWQVANEPRAFSEDPAAKAAFEDWVLTTARIIKEMDPNHLVSTGSEGKHGCEGDLDLWTRIHTSPYIDYGIIHLWPYNWGWVNEENLVDNVPVACTKTEEYIRPHYEAMAAAGRPLVLEEFGYPRDGFKFSKDTPTSGRDRFYEYVFGLIRDSGMIQGCNIWAWGGEAEPQHLSWQPGDPYTGDPAQEQQGLNSVFTSDKSTIDVITRMAEQIRK